MKSLKPVDAVGRYQAGFLASMDGRCESVKELRGRLRTLVDEQGGPDVISYKELALCERFVFLEAQLRRMEQAAIGTTMTDLNVYINGARCLGEYASPKKLGLGRKAKPILSLDEYVKVTYGQRKSQDGTHETGPGTPNVTGQGG